MKGKLLHILRSIYEDIVHTGVDEGISKYQEKRIIRFNQFIILALLVNFFSVASYLIHKLYISGLINITSAYLFMLAYYFNYKRWLTMGRILSIINVNLYIIVINHVEGLRAGEYFFYFPYLLVLTFVVSIRKNAWELLLVYVITITSLLVCILGNPQVNNIQAISERLYMELYNVNLFLSLASAIVFSYSIMRLNRDNELDILQEKKFGDTIYNTSLDGVFIIFSDTNIINSCNRRALELFEAGSHREIEGTHIEHWFTEDHIRHFSSIEQSVSEHSKNWQGELTFVSKNGKTFYGYVSVVPFMYKGVPYIKVSILDISELKMTAFELMKAKEKAEVAGKAKSRFLSNMSHELRTPLNGIIGSTNLLLAETCLPEQKPQLDILKFSSEHMMTLINGILDYNKIDSGKMELEEAPVNMKEWLEKIVAQFVSQVSAKGLQFIADIDNGLDIEVITDQTRLYQVLSNLLSNAIKFTHEGSICLSVKQLFSSSTRATLRFMIADTGIGIPKDKQKEIFSSFMQADADTTRKYGGTGLGLTISKELVSKFNSELVVSSNPGKGSVFEFTLDLKINEHRQLYINEDKSRNLETLAGARILIAEDNAVNMSVARRFLQKWGIEVTEAVNGREALAQFKMGAYDLLLIDLEMPEMDGAAVLREVRKLNPEIPALAFTAAVYDDMQGDLLQKGFSDFIRKPFRPEDLHNKIAHYLVARHRA